MAVAPTRSNLLQLKEQLQIAREGHDLMDEKREVMIMELMNNVRHFKDLENEVEEKLNAAFRAIEKAVVTCGRREISKFCGRTVELSVDTRMRSVMGIPIPELMADTPGEKAPFSLESTDENFDQALLEFREVAQLLVKWAEKEILLWRLGHEINKTQKRVNALENIFIPRYNQQIKYIEEFLEEEEREEFFRRKRLQARKE